MSFDDYQQNRASSAKSRVFGSTGGLSQSKGKPPIILTEKLMRVNSMQRIAESNRSQTEKQEIHVDAPHQDQSIVEHNQEHPEPQQLQIESEPLETKRTEEVNQIREILAN